MTVFSIIVLPNGSANISQYDVTNPNCFSSKPQNFYSPFLIWPLVLIIVVVVISTYDLYDKAKKKKRRVKLCKKLCGYLGNSAVKNIGIFLKWSLFDSFFNVVAKKLLGWSPVIFSLLTIVWFILYQLRCYVAVEYYIWALAGVLIVGW